MSKEKLLKVRGLLSVGYLDFEIFSIETDSKIYTLKVKYNVSFDSKVGFVHRDYTETIYNYCKSHNIDTTDFDFSSNIDLSNNCKKNEYFKIDIYNEY